MWGQDWRPEFSPEEARRELQIIRDDLHCNAVRICGQDLGRLMTASRHALDCGLQVWLSPGLWDHSPGETLGYIATAAEATQDLHRHRPGQVVFSVGSEAAHFMADIAAGGSVFERGQARSFGDDPAGGLGAALQAGKACRSRTAISFSTNGTGSGSSIPKRKAPDEVE